MIQLKSQALLNRRPALVAAWSLVYIVIAGVGLQHYIVFKSPVFLMGLVCLLQVCLTAGKGATSVRFAYVAVAFGALSMLLPVKTILYLSGASAVLFVLESNNGKLRHAAFFTLVIMSPFFNYFANVFSFPLRLQLTGLAARVMQLSGQHIFAAGNVLNINGNEFTVDPECMGLSMMQVSLLGGIMLGCFYEERYKTKLRLPGLLCIFILVSALNVVSNLLRIVAVVQFNIMPATVMHEVTGLACLLVYVMIPSAVLIRAIVKRSVNPVPANNLAKGGLIKRGVSTGLYLLVTAAVTFSVLNTFDHDEEKQQVVTQPLPVRGYCVERISADIVKLDGPASLIYIKSIRGFYSTEHNPLICWKGSGYTFKKVQKSIIQGNTVYVGVLSGGKEELYTAWWYDNAKRHTISQWSWRWDVFSGGKNYSLINVTCSSYNELYSRVCETFGTGRLNVLL